MKFRMWCFTKSLSNAVICNSLLSISLGEFPTENGLVAPGMFCQYTVRFAPDSLADYDDVLEVSNIS